jgi:S1-C subfamily serine protease
MNARVILAAAALLVTSPGWAAGLDAIGHALPAVPNGAAAPTALPDWQSPVLDDLPTRVIRDALAKPLTDRGALATRGAREIGLYRMAAPSVVLIVTFDQKLGSGSYLGDGRILTNWHVVGGSRIVGVLFKPDQEGAPTDFDGLVAAEVVKTDPKHDLALVKLTTVPKTIKPLELGSPSEIQVGADVFAIGHPTGEAWTYTRGLISQVRNDYQWRGDDKLVHQANVIQTQTPISPGNSGGPLLGETGKILGVNSFKATDGENLNFAISVKDVAAFLQATAVASSGGAERPLRDKSGKHAGASPSGAANKTCTPSTLYSGRTEKGDGDLVLIDSNCDGRADAIFTKPDDKSRPITAEFDSNFDGKIDIIVEDLDRDGRWDISYYDTDFDGKIDLVGYHPDGKIQASRFEKYTENKSARR